MATKKTPAVTAETTAEYLFFQGHDLGNATFVMRTGDTADAVAYAKIHHSNPYAPGFVMVLTDTSFTRMRGAE